MEESSFHAIHPELIIKKVTDHKQTKHFCHVYQEEIFLNLDKNRKWIIQDFKFSFSTLSKYVNELNMQFMFCGKEDTTHPPFAIPTGCRVALSVSVFNHESKTWLTPKLS